VVEKTELFIGFGGQQGFGEASKVILGVTSLRFWGVHFRWPGGAKSLHAGRAN